MTPPPITPDDPAAWSRALGFSLDALALNRKGLVSPEQLGGFGGDMFRSIGLSLVFIGAAVAIACLAKPWWRWLAVLGQLGFATFFIVQGAQSYLDHTRKQVLSVQGKPQFFGGYRHSMIVKVGDGKTFTFPERTNGQDTESLFPPDRRYRFYYLRYSGSALSVEPVRESP